MRTVEHGWIEGRPSAEVEAWAVERQRQGDASGIQPLTGLPAIAPLETRAKGFVAERFVHAWLDGEGVSYTAHGGPDPLPDLEIGNVTVGVRSQGSNAPVAAYHDLYIFAKDLGRVDWRLFCTFAPRYLILGGIAEIRIQDIGQFQPDGAPHPRWGKVVGNIYTFQIDDLIAPAAFLETVAQRPGTEYAETIYEGL